MDSIKQARSHPLTQRISWMTAIAIGLLIVLVYGFYKLGTAEANSKTITVAINGLVDTYVTSSDTVGELISELNITGPIISVTPAKSTQLNKQTVVTIITKPANRNSTVAANMQATIKQVQEEIKKQEEALKIPKSPIYEGLATWYTFGTGMNTASRQFPRGTKLRVIAINSGKYIDVIVNDFGPEDWTGIDLDLNRPAFAKLAPLGAGIIPIRYYKI